MQRLLSQTNQAMTQRPALPPPVTIGAARLLMKLDAIILGAGAAGMAAARILSDAGQRVLILEARDRIGGRIHTVRDRQLNIPIELGAEFIHGRPEVTWNIVRQSMLTALDLPFDYKRLHAGQLVDLGDIDRELAKVMGGLAHLGRRDKSFADYFGNLDAKAATPEARQFAISFVEGFDAADPQRISAKALAEEQQGIGDVEDETQFRLLDGYQSLIEYLRGSLVPDRVKIRLRTPISEIRWRKSRVEACSRATRYTFTAARAIITLPLGVLQLPPEMPGSIRFAPDISDWRTRSMQLAFGPVVKAIVRFREPLWEKSKSLRDISFMHNPAAVFPTFWTLRPLRVPVITAWAGGPKAASLAGLSRQKLQEAVIDSLAPLIKTSPRRLASLIDHFYFHDWAADPFSRGAYSYVAVGGMSARPKLVKPIENTLFFAGEAIDTSGQASTVAGALASGQRAANLLLKTV